MLGNENLGIFLGDVLFLECRRVAILCFPGKRKLSVAFSFHILSFCAPVIFAHSLFCSLFLASHFVLHFFPRNAS